MDTAAERGAPATVPGTLEGVRRLSLLWRVLLVNAAVLAVGTAVLALSPATVSSPVLLTEAAVLAGALAVALVVNALLLRATLAPLDRLRAVMERVDLLRPGDRVPEDGAPVVADLIRSFNTMVDRLEHERGTSNAEVLAAQEGERQRIAQELHDEVGQSLTVVLLSLRRLADQVPPEWRDEVALAQETTRGSLDEVRQVVRRLRPGVLEDLGLVNALSSLASEHVRLTRSTVLRHFAPGLPVLTRQTELVVYRVAQEALTNIARHAQAQQVEMVLEAVPEPRAVVLRVTDDGRGLRGAREGAGILGMRERALLVGGELTIGRARGRGTEVRLAVPVPVEQVA